MSAYIDYFKQIARGENVTKEILDKRYREFLNFIYKSKASDIEREKELLQLRFDYLVGAKILEGANTCLNYIELKNQYDKLCILAREKQKELNKNATLRNERTNPYRNLSVPQNADKYRIDTSYCAQLENLNKSFEKETENSNKDLENIVTIYAYYLLYTDARDLLLDKTKRRYIDEEISLGFNPNQEYSYPGISVSNLKYIENQGKRISYEMNNKYGDKIVFEHVGNLEYGQFGKKHPLFQDRSTLQKYKIHKIYNSMKKDDGTIPEKDYEIFTYLNINQMSLDENFTAAHSNILFSDVNIEEAIEHNGGYVGEVEYDNGKIVVVHAQDKLSACKEYKKQSNLGGKHD